MHTHKKTVRTTIDFLDEEHKRLKAIAALKGMSFRELVLDCVREKYEKTPNTETLEAFHQSEKGIDLIEYKSVADMYKKLGIKC